jgi:hypothetical protein
VLELLEDAAIDGIEEIIAPNRNMEDRSTLQPILAPKLKDLQARGRIPAAL